MAAPAAAASGGHVTSGMPSFVVKGVISASVPRPCGTTRRVNRWLRWSRVCWAICACDDVEITKNAPKVVATRVDFQTSHLATIVEPCWFMFPSPIAMALTEFHVQSHEEEVNFQWGLGEGRPLISAALLDNRSIIHAFSSRA